MEHSPTILTNHLTKQLVTSSMEHSPIALTNHLTKQPGDQFHGAQSYCTNQTPN